MVEPADVACQAISLLLKRKRIDDGGLIVVDTVEGGLLEFHLLPRRVHLIGQQHCEARMYALAHLGL
jgi:hypothetical protein